MKHPRPMTACLLAGLSSATLLAVACSSHHDDEQILDGGHGQMVVEIHDLQAPGIAECWITIESVQVQRMHGDWTLMAGDYPHTFDLLTLVNGRTRILGSQVVSPGFYDRFRMHLGGARLVLDDGSEVQIQLPHGGMLHEVPATAPCRVDAGDVATVSLDFRVETSFRHDGNHGWRLDPDIVMDDMPTHGHQR